MLRTDLEPPAPIIICGRGGSGSKRLLKLFDLSPETHCRNEPNGLAGSRFQHIPELRPVSPGLFAEHFGPALDRACRSIGVRDRLPTPPKRHHRRWAWNLQLWRLYKHGSLRRAAGRILPGLRGEEWLAPPLLYDLDRLRSARAVIKLGGIAAWVPPLIEQRPELHVLNIVRHPAAVLSSWRHRLVPRFSSEEMLRANRERIRQLHEDFPGWTGRIPPAESLDAASAECWNWLFMVTFMYEAGDGHPRYHLIRDEDILLNPLETARELFLAVGLPWSGATERFILQKQEHWLEHSRPWRELVSPAEAGLIERVLEGTPQASWWDPEQRVSQHDYDAY